MPEMIKPSDVKKPLMDTPWQNSERETIATNILKLSRFANSDDWKPFTWEDYVEFCSHTPSHGEKAILDEFAENGYLKKDGEMYEIGSNSVQGGELVFSKVLVAPP
jgi:hypothetical protein